MPETTTPDARKPAIRQRRTRDDLAHLSGLERGAYRLFEFLSSIRLAVVVLPWLILECIAGALIEAKVNAGGARYFVYGAWHFYACLALLAVNIFCAALIRFPWKRYQTGFVVTHVGLLILLFGSFLTLRHKLDSLMVASKFEGESDDKRWARTIVDPTKEVVEVAELDPETGKEKNVYRTPVELGPFTWGDALLGFIPWRKSHEETYKLPTGDELRFKEFYAHCAREETYVPSESGVAGVPAVKAVLGFDGQSLFSRWIPLGTQPKSIDLRFGVLSAWKAKSDEHWRHFLNSRPKQTDAASAGGGLLGWLTATVGDKQHRFRVDDLRRGKSVPIPASKDAIEVVDYFPDAKLGAQAGSLVAGGDEPNNPGLHLRIVRDGKPLDAYVLADPFKNRAIAEKQPAPYRFAYRTAEDAGPQPSLSATVGDRHATFTLDELRHGPVTIPGTDVRLELLEFLASARVAPDGGKLINEEGAAPNPAARLAVDRPGRPRAEVLCFGDRTLDDLVDARRDVRLTLFTAPQRPLIELCLGGDGRLAYRAWSSESLVGAGELEIGQPVPSWSIPQRNATILLSAEGIVANGRPDNKLIPKTLEPRENGERGAVVELRTPGGGKATVNLYRNPDAFDDETAWVTVQVKDRLLKVRLASEELQLPFALRLEDFVEPKIPGTNQAAMYSSIVMLKDERQKVEDKHLITMNRPLRHTAASDDESLGFLRSILDPLVPQSYAFYQTSILQTERGPMSTFTVSRDPGIIIKYLGFLTSTVGIFLMFYMGGYFRSARATGGAAEGDDE